MRASSLSDNTKLPAIGEFFTPIEWAEFAINKFGLFEKWMKGATIFDPTMGIGNLLEGLITYGIKKGYSPKTLPINNLFGVEINNTHYDTFFYRIAKEYGIKLIKDNYANNDIFFLKKERVFDIIFGNPPWLNFVDLPENYKPKIKSEFFKYDLINNARDLLLGGSRIDIAALVIQKTIEKNLIKSGEAVYFIPLSLLLNDGANKYFRKYSVNGVNYCIDQVYDFSDKKVFDKVSTRYGLIHISRDKKQSFPIDYKQSTDLGWIDSFARPAQQPSDPLSIMDHHDQEVLKGFRLIALKKESTPRQGINTCGANDVYFFESAVEKDSKNYLVKNNSGEFILPKKYVFPLIINKNFLEESPKPKKWVLLPYNKNGKPLEPELLNSEANLKKYLQRYEGLLKKRKGTLINTWIKKKYWWALLGVGEYSFFPHKIVWEAYGKSKFTPRIFLGNWQANQSLQAFIPVKTVDEADKTLQKLLNKQIEQYLLSLKMSGTMNWAQPGKIKKLIRFEGETLSLFST